MVVVIAEMGAMVSGKGATVNILCDCQLASDGSNLRRNSVVVFLCKNTT